MIDDVLRNGRIVRVEQQERPGEFGVAAMIESIEPLSDSAAGHA